MVILGAQNRPREGRRGEQTRLARRSEPNKLSSELQEAPEEAPSHDPSALPSENDLPEREESDLAFQGVDRE